VGEDKAFSFFMPMFIIETMKSILLIQFRSDETLLHERECFNRYFRKGDIELGFLDILKDDFDFSSPKKILKNYQAIILGGSSEFYFSGNKKENEEIFRGMLRRISSLVKYVLEKDLPTLGVCFGHQILGYFLGEKVVNDPGQAETGSFSVSLTKEGKESPIFCGLPQNFVAQFGHRDSLKGLPKGAKLLAKSKRCKVAAFSYKRNIYGVQFHPELTLKDVKFRLSLHPEYKEGKIPLFSSILSSKILENFFNIAYAD